MSKQKRIIVMIVVVELMLAGLWYFLNNNANGPEAARTIGETMGMAMGAIAGLSPLLYLMARKNDLATAQRK